MNKVYLGFVLFITSILMSCNFSDSAEKPFNYLPFQSEEGGKWGLISLDGKILFEEEFKNQPTCPYYDRFMVLNKDSLWEYYTVEEKPRKIGKEYQYGTDFSKCGVAVVARPGKNIEVIDLEGETVFDLNKFEGHKVVWVGNFSKNGLSGIITEEGLFGCINSEGQTVLKPGYCDITIGQNCIVAVDVKDIKSWNRHHASVKRLVFNERGDKIAELPANKYEEIYPLEGYLVAKVVEGKDTIEGIMDTKGEWVVKPEKNMVDIRDIRKEYFIYSDGESVGMKDFKGNLVIRPKYYDIKFTLNDNRLVAIDGDNYESARRKIIDYDGKQVGNETYDGCYFGAFDDFTIVQVSKNNYTAIDKDGNELKNVPEIFNVDCSDIDSEVRTQEVNVKDLINRLKITENGIDDLSIGMSVSEVHKHGVATCDSLITKYRIPSIPEPYYYSSIDNREEVNEIKYGRFVENTDVCIDFVFEHGVTTYKNDKVVFSNAKSGALMVVFDTEKIHMLDIYKALRNKIEKFGTVIDENEKVCNIKGKVYSYHLTYRVRNILDSEIAEVILIYYK